MSKPERRLCPCKRQLEGKGKLRCRYRNIGGRCGLVVRVCVRACVLFFKVFG